MDCLPIFAVALRALAMRRADVRPCEVRWPGERSQTNAAPAHGRRIPMIKQVYARGLTISAHRTECDRFRIVFLTLVTSQVVRAPVRQ